MLDVNLFDELRIGLATADDIQNWSYGEVKKPETINYRTPSQRRTACSARRSSVPPGTGSATAGYKRVRFKGIICRALRRRGDPCEGPP